MTKKIIFGLMSAIMLFAASCTNDVEQLSNEGKTTTVSFKVSTPEIASRTFGNGETATILNYATYIVNGNDVTLLDDESLTNSTTIVDKKVTLNLNLVTGLKYRVVFWAAAENAPYTFDAENKKVTVNYDNATSNAENRDAFYHCEELTVESADTKTVKLKRPFAQLNIGTSDLELAEKAGMKVTHSYVKVENLYSELNLMTGEATGNSAEQEFKYAEIPTNETFPVDDYNYLAMNYLLVGEVAENGDKALVDVTFSYAEKDAEGNTVNEFSRTVGSVPVQRNYRTNIYGKLLTSTTDINVEIKPGYDGAYNNEHLYYKEGDIYYIASAEGLNYFAEQVNAGNAEWLNAHVALDCDIDLNESRSTANWTPIGLSTDLANGKTFRGTFDGKGHTIRNMVCEGTEVAGLFGYLYAATIKNVTIENATIKSNHFAAGIVAWVNNYKGNIQKPFVIENCHVQGSTITSTPEEVNGEWDNGDKVGGLVGAAWFNQGSGLNEGTKIANCSVSSTTIKAYRDFGGLVGYAQGVNVENCTANVTLEQDLSHNYKDTTPTTFSTTFGNNAGLNTVDDRPYLADGVTTDEAENYHIYNAAGLKWLADEVNKYSNYEHPFEGKVIYLTQDVDLNGVEWTPIGDYRFSANRFCGTFDGQGHTISNFKITKKTDKNDSNKSSYGFFGNVEGTIKNLTVANATVNSYAYTGALAGRLNSGLIENCHVVDCEVSNTYWQGGILIGQVNGESNTVVVRNCSVKDSKVTSKSAIGAIAGPTTTTKEGSATFENCVVENCQVIQMGSFGDSYDNYFGTMFGYLDADATSRINVNNCTAINTTVKGEPNAMFAGDIDGNIYVNGGLAVATAEVLKAVLQAGGDYALVSDIYLSEPIQIENKTFSLNGNGYKIGQSSEYPAEGTAVAALIHPIGGKVTIKNVVFDGVKVDAAIRTADTELLLDNVTVKNCIHTKDQGLLRLLGESTIKNSTFVNNNCNMVVSLNFDGNGTVTSPQLVENCVFEGNTCNTIAVLYYAEGGSATIDGNKFLNNTLNVSNGATVYLGFKKNCTVTNNVFDGNTVTATSKRSSGGLMVGNAAVVTGNCFVNNTVTVNGQTGYGNDVCASPYYAPIDLSGNYWGGVAPVEGDDYYKEYNNYEVIINDYLTTYGE